jgi:FkbM family methyltransferase
VDHDPERRRRQFAVGRGEVPPHPVFTKIEPWEGWVEPRWDVNFLGVRTRVDFFRLYDELGDFSQRRHVVGAPPIPNEDYFEWIALLEAVTEAEREFTMVELGAGWGKWIVAGVAALRQYRPLPYHIVGVESEPTHFRWMKQHLVDNDVNPDRATLIEAAVAREDGHVWFHVGGAADWYGQSIAEQPSSSDVTLRRRLAERLKRTREISTDRTVRRVRAVSLTTILKPLARVDLIDIDIQGTEAEVVEQAAAAMEARVRRVYVATHDRENERRVRAVFRGLGWESLYDFPCGVESATPWGRVLFEDGAQVWRNNNV